MIKFYYLSGSPFAWRVWLALEHKAIPYQKIDLSFSDGDLRTPEYLSVSPRGKVPAIVHENECFIESSVILEYLDEKFTESQNVLFPSEPLARARVRQLINEVDLYLDLVSRKLMNAVFFTRRENWEPLRIVEASNRVSEELATINRRYDLFFSEQLTAADFTIFPIVKLIERLGKLAKTVGGEVMIGDRIEKRVSELENIPIFQKTWPPHWIEK
jgi:glutathione S-transferase